MTSTDPASHREFILLLGHGSRNLQAQADYLALTRLVEARVRPLRVQPAFLELASPSTGEAVRLCAGAGAEIIYAIPVFMSAASHVKEDLPEELEAARLEHPNLSIQFGQPLGMDGAVHDILLERLGEVASADELRDSAVLLAGRGSPDPQAARDLDWLADRFRDRFECRHVATGHVDRARPDISEALLSCRDGGASRILVLPCLFFQGIVLDRLYRAVDQFRQSHPGTTVQVASTLGPHPKLADLIVTRILECREGAADTRAPLS